MQAEAATLSSLFCPRPGSGCESMSLGLPSEVHRCGPTWTFLKMEDDVRGFRHHRLRDPKQKIFVCSLSPQCRNCAGSDIASGHASSIDTHISNHTAFPPHRAGAARRGGHAFQAAQQRAVQGAEYLLQRCQGGHAGTAALVSPPPPCTQVLLRERPGFLLSTVQEDFDAGASMLIFPCGFCSTGGGQRGGGTSVS
jgi:hypothetical protein